MKKFLFQFLFIFLISSCGAGSNGSSRVIAIPDNATTYEDTSVTINVLLNDYYSSSLPISVVTANGSNGISTLAGSSPEQIVYSPNTDYNGTDIFSYTITQGNKTSSADVTVTIEAVNDAPSIDTASTIQTDENQSAVTTVSVSDIDEDNLTLSLHGTDEDSFNLSSGNILTFKEAPDYEIKDSYSITLILKDEVEETSKDINIIINDLPELNTSSTYPLTRNEYDFTYFNKASFNFFVEEIASFSSKLWGLKILNNSHILASEQKGFFHLLDIETQQLKSINLNDYLDLYTQSQGGIFNFSFKKISDNFFDIYFLSSVFDELDRSKKRLALYRLNIDLTTLSFSAPEKIYEAFANSDSGHFGGAIEVYDNTIFISSGDRHCRACPQNVNTNIGKILRFNIDENNNVIPHKENSVNSEMQEIFSIGHRNPQGIEYIEFFNKILSSEHGPLGGDEINFLIAGENYGWPLASTGTEYSGAPIEDHIDGMQDGVTYYIPSIAPRDLIYVHENKLFPELDNSILLSSLNRELIIVIYLNSTRPYQEIIELNGFGRVSSIDIDENGEIYFATHSTPGKIYKLSR
ncbi:PQQ-dependent sugar dehydrogenase [Gammaproteobacteria bacterium]|nr:PQQ-dependent sugar dehydrogenase [Gammaproteobacteria bacterium]